ncbi:hypothetical protein F5878DRAFT_636312 [Lentinula raphanica]|uniref:Bromo domain-containing protein n=1 Tax=Lentinula raphanica TaxID=153919 RepID=A0AA38NVF5_9AGAR|nr:hypothetical protein F5878DRAFT_636312 [Lentinula raphanica]
MTSSPRPQLELRLAFERIFGYDEIDFFKNFVSKAGVPDYFDVITRPMHWSLIDAKARPTRILGDKRL